MWASIQRDYADVVNHLDQNRYVSGGLQDLIIVVVLSRKHRWSGGGPQNASHEQRKVFRSFGRMFRRFRARGCSLLRFRRQGWNFPIGRVEDERCSPRWYD